MVLPGALNYLEDQARPLTKLVYVNSKKKYCSFIYLYFTFRCVLMSSSHCAAVIGTIDVADRCPRAPSLEVVISGGVQVCATDTDV